MDDETKAADAEEKENQTSAEASDKKPKKKMKKWKKIVIITAIVLVGLILLLFLAGVIYFFTIYNKVYEKIPIVERSGEYVRPALPDNVIDADDYKGDIIDEDDTGFVLSNDSTADIGTPIVYREPKDPNILNILLIGRDSRNPAYEWGRSDAMIVLSYNRTNDSIKLTSIMRDTLVPIEGHDWNRLNTAFAFGGPGLAINTINDLFNLDIQNYVTIDFSGIEQVIDAIGGVDITLTKAEADYYVSEGILRAKEGVNHMNGSFARVHLGNRWVNGDGDFSRTQRQRTVLIAMYNQVVNNFDIKKLSSLVTFCISAAKTNISKESLISLGTAVMKIEDITIETYNAPFDGMWSFAYYNQMSVLQIDIDAVAEQISKNIYG